MSGVGLTNTDLSTHDNLVQARHELRRATSEARLAAWADKWGEACLDEIEDPQSDVVGDLKAELEEERGNAKWADEMLTDASAEMKDMRIAARAFVADVRDLIGNPPPVGLMPETAIATLMDALEKAL